MYCVDSDKCMSLVYISIICYIRNNSFGFSEPARVCSFNIALTQDFTTSTSSHLYSTILSISNIQSRVGYENGYQAIDGFHERELGDGGRRVHYTRRAPARDFRDARKSVDQGSE